MIEILNKPIHEQFYNLVANSKSSIKLCSPYVKESIIKNIYDTKKKHVNVEYISNFSISNFYKGSSDIEAFKNIIEHDDDIFNCQTLHGKFYIFDNKYSIITSANLTYSGFKKNIEYGVLIKDIDLVNKTILDFKNICKHSITGKIDIKKIIHIEKILNTLPTYKDIILSDYEEENEIDSILNVDTDLIKAQLSNWKRTTFHVIELLNKSEFTLSDIYYYEDIFMKEYPNNNTIQDSIRRNLQELRDLGLIKFLGNGTYKKLWLKDKETF